MADPLLFAFSVAILLAVPGPTNMLLAAAGASIGVRRSLRLLPAVLAGYLIAITIFLGAAAPLLSRWPAADALPKLAAAAYLAWSAPRLWRRGTRSGSAGAVPAGRIFATTLLNPKGLILALAIFPHRAPIPAYPVFSLLCVSIGSGWLWFGRGLAMLGRQAVTPKRVWRVTAVVHACFAMLLAGSALHAPA